MDIVLYTKIEQGIASTRSFDMDLTLADGQKLDCYKMNSK